MPDILIRGMEMPKTCFDCPFFVVFHKKQMGICTAFGDGTNREKMSDRKKETGRMSGCPLHDLPEHGDLIEAEPIKKFITDGLNSGEFGHDTIEVLTEVEYAPVIVPASEEANHDEP